ncbi:transcription factor A, mitochondrial isoform X1 [Zootermopsis nevadensis]|uniref:transcription factor A, mitochondrial isoform X1 n=1 Tax=Zootermopsis nevadensis TaxID=136037 RepID=UPI000B8E2119|nr:transcription factor A, mitochondrial isoform X1 [Zootermopsis nevadensis]
MTSLLDGKRNTTSFYQQNAGLKKSLEEKLGLPPKPKKPLTPYFRFMVQIRPNLVQKNPQAKVTDIVKLTAQEWEKADITVRQKLEADYKREMVDFTAAQVKYNKMLTDEQREEIKLAKIDIAESKEKRMLKKKMKELGKPKKPLSAFLLFMNERKDRRGTQPFRDWQVAMGNEWENLPEEEKSQYLTQYKKASEGYKHEIQIWEEKMIRLGHIDVVRNEALIEPKEHSTRVSRRPRGSEQ